MSLRSFTVLALSLRKREDLDLRPTRIHSYFRPRSFAFHVVAQEPPSAKCRQIGNDAEGCRAWFIHSPLVNAASEAGQDDDSGVRVANLTHPPSRHLQTDVSLERHLSRIFPMSHSVTRSVLIPRPAARHGSASAAPP
ncbi:hypothetical protein [Acidobacterium sp. S8]|uniref:hypothetical protein n=1 Tax=Acidobacterium sp. S8 TaxID=1641854 RepID=UPI00131DA9CC|nr:hypothetical protein [Acidobacterium sp. S8]